MAKNAITKKYVNEKENKNLYENSANILHGIECALHGIFIPQLYLSAPIVPHRKILRIYFVLLICGTKCISTETAILNELFCLYSSHKRHNVRHHRNTTKKKKSPFP